MLNRHRGDCGGEQGGECHGRTLTILGAAMQTLTDEPRIGEHGVELRLSERGLTGAAVLHELRGERRIEFERSDGELASSGSRGRPRTASSTCSSDVTGGGRVELGATRRTRCARPGRSAKSR